MNNNNDFNISQLIEELDSAVICGDTAKADEIADILYRLQGGTIEAAIMPEQFPIDVAIHNKNETGGHLVKTKSIKRIVCIAAAAALVMALGVTALATHLFGIKDFVIGGDSSGSASGTGTAVSDNAETDSATTAPSGETKTTGQDYDLIAMQGYPDSKEYQASAEWELFRKGYDTDQAVLNTVGNKPNEFTEKYPMYLVYSKEMADKLEEIIAKYGLTLHTSIVIPEKPEDFFTAAGTGNFLETKNSTGVNTNLGGYVYNDGTFQFDGQAVLTNGAVIGYQFANYVKGTFSDVCLNIGNADTYKQWQYTTKSGVQVSLALSETKALIIADLNNSFVIANVLAGTSEDSGFGSSSITADDLQNFADMFDFTQIKN